MCMLSPQPTQTVGRFRLRREKFACETLNFASETTLFRQAPSQAIEIVGARNFCFRGFVRFQRFATLFFRALFSPSVFRSARRAWPNSVSQNSSITRIRFQGK